jgi:ATP-dependent Lhr-like helicase
LRGRFRKGLDELEWCDRRLLARIHRLTLNRLRAEIQPVSIAEFQRFLLAWQRVDGEHQAEGPEGARAVLELLDGYELPAAAWEPEVLALRVKQYHPQTLDQLCFTGRFGWGRLSGKPIQNGRASAPVRSSPVSVFARENLAHWLALSSTVSQSDLTPDTERVRETLRQGGALFFGELVKRSGLLPSRVEQSLAELVTLGCVTSDSFEGLRALLVPQERRTPFGDFDRKRRHKPITSLEHAGRWSWLGAISRANGSNGQEEGRQSLRHLNSDPVEIRVREEAMEAFARALLRRYGVIFRRLLEREPFNISWYELGRIYRRLEARGEIRGGYFVGGVSGEQFALPEAIGLLRSTRNAPTKGELITISAADPLNLVGILTPGRRITAISANRILLRDGVAIAALEAGQVTALDGSAEQGNGFIENALRLGTLPAALRPYYA